MTSNSRSQSTESASSTESSRHRQAEILGTKVDPLQEYESRFRRLDQADEDPFELFWDEYLETDNLKERTLEEYERTFRQWRTFMDSRDRHPVCPTVDHVKQFIQYLRQERGNQAKTIKGKLRRLNRFYRFLQDEPIYPHNSEYNPIALARSKVDLSTSNTKDPHHISMEELQGIVRDTTHYRDRAIMVFQLKFALRATALCNIKLKDIHLTHSGVQDHYESLGTHEGLQSNENAIYIPSKYERDGNKSSVPRILPLDDEVRRVLLEYLLIRPDNGSPYLFLSKETHSQMHRNGVNTVWKKAIPDKYLEETNQFRAITSHYGRHRFTTYWTVHQGLDRYDPKVLYMRGDSENSPEAGGKAVDEYIHTYYEDIEDLYRERIFKVGV